MSQRLALFGQPVEHSVSPWLHGEFGKRCGIDLDYQLIETPPGTLMSALDRFAAQGGIGANVTLPLKAEALDCCATVTEAARRADAVNTLKFDGNDWHGDNTDGAGFLHDLVEVLDFQPAGKRVLVAGAGGAARAVLEALLSTGATAIFVANRNAVHATGLAKESKDPRVAGCSYPVLGDSEPFDLIVNATAAGHSGEAPPLPRGVLAQGGWCYDLTYGTPAQPFLDWAKSQGAVRAVDGRGMLIEQGALSFQAWFGVCPGSAGLREQLPLR